MKNFTQNEAQLNELAKVEPERRAEVLEKVSSGVVVPLLAKGGGGAAITAAVVVKFIQFSNTVVFSTHGTTHDLFFRPISDEERNSQSGAIGYLMRIDET